MVTIASSTYDNVLRLPTQRAYIRHLTWYIYRSRQSLQATKYNPWWEILYMYDTCSSQVILDLALLHTVFQTVCQRLYSC